VATEFNYSATRDGLRILQQAPRATEVFGARAHGFRVHTPLPEKTVIEFDAEHGIRLPSEYLEFLVRVGNGGAGPAYGLFKLGEMDDGSDHREWKEGDGFVGVLSEPFPLRTAWNDCMGEPAYDESREGDPEWEDDYHRRMDEWEDTYWNSNHVNGAIPVCHLGCALPPMAGSDRTGVGPYLER
jgi:hypothetical protein